MAELAKAEATARAEQERTRRRLTLALAASLLGMVALGGGGWAWAWTQRDARRAETARAVDELHQRLALNEFRSRQHSGFVATRVSVVAACCKTELMEYRPAYRRPRGSQ